MSKSVIDVEHFRKALVALREELLELQRTGDEAAETVELDQSRVGRLSRMDAMQAQSMSIEAKRRRKLKLQAIAASLERIGRDEYGHCFGCAEDINPNRLDVDPTATLCIDCASSRQDSGR